MMEFCHKQPPSFILKTTRRHFMNSDSVFRGLQQAPHRSLFNAIGLTEEERKRPLIGIISSQSEIIPGHVNIDKIAEAVKLGIAEAGGTPIIMPAIAV
jgi:dihydroxy-acid dehydratase